MGSNSFEGSSILMMATLVESAIEARLVGDQKKKIPFVAALELNDERRPIQLKLNRVSGFTDTAIGA
jgi:hypothetical protein